MLCYYPVYNYVVKFFAMSDVIYCLDFQITTADNLFSMMLWQSLSILYHPNQMKSATEKTKEL